MHEARYIVVEDVGCQLCDVAGSKHLRQFMTHDVSIDEGSEVHTLIVSKEGGGRKRIGPDSGEIDWLRSRSGHRKALVLVLALALAMDRGVPTSRLQPPSSFDFSVNNVPVFGGLKDFDTTSLNTTYELQGIARAQNGTSERLG
jgi:hypothetical protein